MLTFATTTPKALLTTVAGDTPPENKKCSEKITVVGAGTCGSAIAFTLLTQNISSEIVLIDKKEALARGETLDLRNASMLLDFPKISCSTDYTESSNSKIVIITAGTRHFDNAKNEAMKQNTQIFREIVPAVVAHSPNCILIVCSHPVDEMSYVAWKLSGLPPHRVLGTGNMLENSRFRTLIAQQLNVHPADCQAFLIGEQGHASIPVWSSVSVAGVPLKDVNPDLGGPRDPEDWQSLHNEVVEGADEVICLKECPSWGLALGVAKLVKAILDDSGECFTLSSHIKGCRHGIDKDVFLSLPCIVGSSGIKYYIKQSLNEEQKDKMQVSADRMYELFKAQNLVAQNEGDVEFICP